MDRSQYSPCASTDISDSFDLRPLENTNSINERKSVESMDETFQLRCKDERSDYLRLNWGYKEFRISPRALVLYSILLLSFLFLENLALVKGWVKLHMWNKNLSDESVSKIESIAPSNMLDFEYSSLAAADTIIDIHVPGAVLHPDQNTLLSPNGQWRVRLADDGDLIHERWVVSKIQNTRTSTMDWNSTIAGENASWSPVWWSNTADYKRKNQTSCSPYLTVDVKGEVVILMRYTIGNNETASVRHHWSSSGNRRCTSGQRRRDQPRDLKPQSLIVGNDGSLLVTDDSSDISCDFFGNHLAEIPSMHNFVDTQYEEEKPDIKADYWPLFRNSDLATNRQIRAMLEKDLARKNRTFSLTQDQLETAYKTALIIPSWHGHVEFVTKFMRSLIRNCADCEHWQIDIILEKVDFPVFEQALFGTDNISYWLPGIRLLEYEAFEFEHYDPQLNVAEVTKSLHKIGYQDFKKMYGCIATRKEYCYILDSEATLIRTTWMSDMVKDYLDAPFVIHNPDDRNGTSGYVDWSTPCAQLEGIEHFERLGWLLEYYEWIMDAKAYSETARRIAKAFPKIKGIDEVFFEDICYYAYVWANPDAVAGPQYKFITTKDFLGHRIYEAMWERWANGKTFEHLHPDFHVEDRIGKNTPSLMEDMRKWLVSFPTLMAPVAERWNEANLRLFHPSPDFREGLAFLGIARSVQLLVSEAPRDLYEAAMAGTFNLD